MPLVTITSTFFAPAGNVGSSTGMLPVDVEGTIVPVGTLGAVSPLVFNVYDGDHSLSSPSGNTY
jgi:hypothetical protein